MNIDRNSNMDNILVGNRNWNNGKNNIVSFYRNGVLMTSTSLSAIGSAALNANLHGNYKILSKEQDFYMDEFMLNRKILSQEELKFHADRYGIASGGRCEPRASGR